MRRSSISCHLKAALFVFVIVLAACIHSTAPARNAAALPREFSVQTPDGLTIAAEERGPAGKPAILFIHGLGFSRVAWRRQMDSPLVRDFRLVAYDLRGHGRSERPAAGALYSEGRRWGDELAAVIASAHLRKAVLVAWSLGVVVVLNYLRDHGDGNIAGVVFVDAVTHFSPELFGPSNPALTQPLQSEDVATRTEATRRFLRACFATPLPPAELDSIISSVGVLPANVHAAIQHISLDGGDETLRSIRVPTLIVHGAKDGLSLPLMAQRTAALAPGSRLLVYPDAGHAPFFDATRRFNDDLADFARRAAR
jgi:pimeloyl-ACP methyl ester carboxylesterase